MAKANGFSSSGDIPVKNIVCVERKPGRRRKGEKPGRGVYGKRDGKHAGKRGRLSPRKFRVIEDMLSEEENEYLPD